MMRRVFAPIAVDRSSKCGKVAMVYETVLNKVKAAAEQLGVRYPIVQDNGFEIWKRYGIWAWPTTILIDKKGIIRYGHVGEGAYEKTEALINQLLAERDP